MLILNLICCLLIAAKVSAQSDPEVQTNYGNIRGFTKNFNSAMVTKFLGIPFAKPPTGTHRFLKPVKIDAWTNVLEARSYSPSCYQSKIASFDVFGGNITESEDCLYLNIFIPGTLASAKTSPKSVMVWIYGGGYIMGNANSYPSDSLALSQDVIVVTFNYRLALFGFMASDDGTIPGNQAMFDQHTALKWVKENIGYFGGDASKITIFGESAGGDSVFNQLMSPLSRNLFTRAIILSTAQIEVVSKEKQYAGLLRIVSSVCKITNAPELLKCLQGLTPEEILQLGDIAVYSSYKMVTVDGEFFTENPNKILSEGKFDISKEVIVGFMADDGDQAVQLFHRDWNGFLRNGVDMRKAKELASLGLDFYYHDNMSNKVIMENLVYQMYLSCYENPLELARGILDQMTDVMFAAKTFKIAHSIAMFGGSVYLYEFDHLLEFMRGELKPNIKYSSGHAQDLAYVFGYLSYYAQSGKTITPAETMLSSSIMKAFSEFAKSGQPVYLTSANRIAQWKAFTVTGKDYIRFTNNMTQSSVQPVPEYLRKRINFWLSVMEGIQKIQTCHPYISETSSWTSSKGMETRNVGLGGLLVITAVAWMQSSISTM